MSTESTTVEENRRRAERVLRALAERDAATVEALVAEDLVHHALGGGSTTEGRDAWWARVGELVAAFPDLRIDVEDVVAAGP